MNYTKVEREQYNQHRINACELLSITKAQYNWLRRQGESLHQIYENDCNGLYQNENESGELCEKIYIEINEYLTKIYPQTKHVIYTYYQTDPRGATIYLDTQPIKRDSYNNAVCIY